MTIQIEFRLKTFLNATDSHAVIDKKKQFRNSRKERALHIIANFLHISSFSQNGYNLLFVHSLVVLI